MVFKFALERFWVFLCLFAPLYAPQDDLLRQLEDIRRQLFDGTPPTLTADARADLLADDISGTGTSRKAPEDRLLISPAAPEADLLDDVPPSLEPSEARPTSRWTPAQDMRRARIASCLATYYRHPIDANKLRPWSIMHGLISYGPRSVTLVNGQPVNCIEYLCANGAGDGMRILYLEDGKLKARLGPGVQGHEGQLLAILAQAGAPADHPLIVDGETFSLQDLIEYEKLGCRSDTELTFKLIALAHYLEPDAVWQNESGETWDMERLIREEIAEPLTEGACGGTHRLTALSYAVQQCVKRDLPLDGEWLRADAYVSAVQGMTFNKFQNSDGSFSTLFYKSRENHPDLNRRAYATGHVVEWLAYSLPESQLHDPRMTAAVDFLLDLMITAPGHKVDVGPRGHALHALNIYERRAFGESSDWASSRNIAELPLTSKGNFSKTNQGTSNDRNKSPTPVLRGGIRRR